MGLHFARSRFLAPGPTLADLAAIARDAGLGPVVVSGTHDGQIQAGGIDPVTLTRFEVEVRAGAEVRGRFVFVEVEASLGHRGFTPAVRALAARGGVDVLSVGIDAVAAPSAAPVGVRLGGFALWPDPVDVLDGGDGARCPVCGAWMSPVSLHEGSCRCGQRIRRVSA